MAEIEYDAVQKVFPDGTQAVHDLDLEIQDGELMVLVGPSGCGKTTALRMLAGLEEISGGEIRIGEVVVNDLTPKERDIAMVFQSYALYPHMTVYDNLAFGLKLHDVPKNEIKERVNRAAKKFRRHEKGRFVRAGDKNVSQENERTVRRSRTSLSVSGWLFRQSLRAPMGVARCH